MDQPIVFVSHWAIRPGALDRLRELAVEVAARFRAERPRTLSWLAYLDEAETNVSFIHVFPDAEAMDRHTEIAAAGATASRDLMEPRGWDLYGKPSDAALEQMRQTAEAVGAPLRLEAQLMDGGFLRLAE
jgi:hypothetical protein